MHLFTRCESLLAILATFAYISSVAADSDANQTVTWHWPPLNDGSFKANSDTPTYNTVDSLNASWSSNLDFDPFLVLWCWLPTGWTASQAGSVPPSGSHLVPLNIDVKGPYPLGCHLGFDDQNHHQLVTQTANSGDFNLTNTPDNGPQVFGQSSSAAADSASALPTASTTGAPAGATTVFVSSVPQDASSGVSTGAIAGIVVGALAAVASVIGALFFLCIRKRRRDRRRIDAEDSIQEDSSRGHSRNVSESQAFMVGEMAADPKPRAELMADTQPVMEKDGEEQRVELPTKGEPEGPVEMEASLPYEGRMKGRSLKR